MPDSHDGLIDFDNLLGKLFACHESEHNEINMLHLLDYFEMNQRK